MALYTPEYKPNGNEVAVIVTDEGTIRERCTARTPPSASATSVELAQKGFLTASSSTVMSRLRHPGRLPQHPRHDDPAEVARGGYGPNGKPGTGGPGYSIKGEWKTNPHNEHKDGTLAMARSSMPDFRRQPVLLLPWPPAVPRR